MRTAAARLGTFPVAKSPRRLWRFVWPVAGWRALTWTGAGAAACLLAAVYLSSEKATAPVAVALASFRGTRPEPVFPRPHAESFDPSDRCERFALHRVLRCGCSDCIRQTRLDRSAATAQREMGSRSLA